MNSILKTSLLFFAIVSFQAISCSDAKTRDQLRKTQTPQRNSPKTDSYQEKQEKAKRKHKAEASAILLYTTVPVYYLTLVSGAFVGQCLGFENYGPAVSTLAAVIAGVTGWLAHETYLSSHQEDTDESTEESDPETDSTN